MQFRAFLPALACIFFAASPSFGQSTGDAAGGLAQAQAYVNDAVRAFRQADYQTALEALQKAEPIAVSVDAPELASIRFNIARCYEELGRLPEALEAYQKYNILPDSPHRKERAWKAIQKLEQLVYATVTVTCAPKGALVEIVGLTKGAQLCPYQDARVKPGQYQLKVSSPGYQTSMQTITATSGAPATIQVVLKQDPISVKSSGGQIVAPPPSEESGKEMSLWPLASLGAGAAAAGVGAFFYVQASDAVTEIEALAPGTARDDKFSAFERDRVLAYSLFGVGGLLAAGAVVLYFIDSSEDGEKTTWVPTGNGVLVRF